MIRLLPLLFLPLFALNCSKKSSSIRDIKLTTDYRFIKFSSQDSCSSCESKASFNTNIILGLTYKDINWKEISQVNMISDKNEVVPLFIDPLKSDQYETVFYFPNLFGKEKYYSFLDIIEHPASKSAFINTYPFLQFKDFPKQLKVELLNLKKLVIYRSNFFAVDQTKLISNPDYFPEIEVNKINKHFSISINDKQQGPYDINVSWMQGPDEVQRNFEGPDFSNFLQKLEIPIGATNISVTVSNLKTKHQSSLYAGKNAPKSCQ